MSVRLICVNDLYAFDPDVRVGLEFSSSAECGWAPSWRVPSFHSSVVSPRELVRFTLEFRGVIAA